VEKVNKLREAVTQFKSDNAVLNIYINTRSAGFSGRSTQASQTAAAGFIALDTSDYTYLVKLRKLSDSCAYHLL